MLEKGEHIMENLIKELGLVPDKRKAVLYYENLGDFYSYCASIEKAEKKLGNEYIILYFSDRSELITGWFEHNDYKIKKYRINYDDWVAIQNVNSDIKNKYIGYFVWWSCGDPALRSMTRNLGNLFTENITSPHFDDVDIEDKYGKYNLKKGRTIFIIPKSNAVRPYPTWYFNFCAEIFKSFGYNVVFNAAPNEAKIYNGTAVMVPLNDVVKFADYCGYVFGMRSGLMDILSSSSADMTIFSTDFFIPIDKLYNIPNENNRIRTQIIKNNDLFFEKSPPFNYITEHINEINKDKHLFAPMENLSSLSDWRVPPVKAYRYNSEFNKTIHNNNSEIASFLKIEYAFKVDNCELQFSLNNLDVTKFRIDFSLYCNSIKEYDVIDYRYEAFSFRPQKSGKYRIKMCITDRISCCQEVFETEEIFYSIQQPDIDSLSSCDDLQAYVLALLNFGKQLTVFISSRDAHTTFNKCDSSNVLGLFNSLGFKVDLQSTFRYSYIGILAKGDVICENFSENQIINADYTFNGHKAEIVSAGFNAVKNDRTSISVMIDGIECSVNKRGLNIVVWDNANDKLCDSVCFDIFDGCAVYRKDKI